MIRSEDLALQLEDFVTSSGSYRWCNFLQPLLLGSALSMKDGFRCFLLLLFSFHSDCRLPQYSRSFLPKLRGPSVCLKYKRALKRCPCLPVGYYMIDLAEEDSRNCSTCFLVLYEQEGAPWCLEHPKKYAQLVPSPSFLHSCSYSTTCNTWF